MKLEDATRFTAKCFNGEPASCSFACPFHLDIRSFLEKAGKGRWTAAYKELTNAVVFPAVVSVLCEQPCRERCQRTVTGDEAIALREIESAVIRHAKNRKPESYFIPPKTQSVAVVGAGPAGLSCALRLAQKKYPVTVFEKGDGWGGSLRNHPRFQEFDGDIALQLSAVDVIFKFEKEIKTLGELKGFDAIYIAAGAGGEAFWLPEDRRAGLLETSGAIETSDHRVFFGGELCGASLMEGIAQGPELSKSIEIFLQTGKAANTGGGYDRNGSGYDRNGGGYDKNYCGHYLEHKGAEASPLIKASSADGYTEEEAKLEAGRCLKCDCELCINACEMLKRFNKKPHRMAVEAFTDLQASVLSSRLMTRETYSCNVCGYCKSICPESVDLGALLQFSRSTRINTAAHPAAFHDYWLREMDFAVSEGSFHSAPNEALHSAPNGKQGCDYAFFPGCQLGASNPEYVRKAYGFLRKNYDAGIILDCCGAPAYWAGDEARLKLNRQKIKEIWDGMGKPTLVFACATCESMFHKFLPDIGGLSLYELMAEAEDINPVRPFETAAVFDPCAAREDHGMELGVRKLASKAGVELKELAEKNRCCGYGGHMRAANPSLYDEIVKNRAEAGAEPYIVYCVNCREVFALQGKRCAHALDLAFGLDADAPVPSLQEKRDNSLQVKRELMEELTGVFYSPAAYEWDELTLLIGDELQKNMDRKLISVSDVKEAVWLAEKTGDKFTSESDGASLCSMVKSVLTYWVQYREAGPKTYEIYSAYCHRMRFGREER